MNEWGKRKKNRHLWNICKILFALSPPQPSFISNMSGGGPTFFWQNLVQIHQPDGISPAIVFEMFVVREKSSCKFFFGIKKTCRRKRNQKSSKRKTGLIFFFCSLPKGEKREKKKWADQERKTNYQQNGSPSLFAGFFTFPNMCEHSLVFFPRNWVTTTGRKERKKNPDNAVLGIFSNLLGKKESNYQSNPDGGGGVRERESSKRGYLKNLMINSLTPHTPFRGIEHRSSC